MTWFLAITLNVAAAAAWFQAGRLSERLRWSRNADDYRRIECYGRLYKVCRDD